MTDVHQGVNCDSCGKKNMEGFRYKCLECSNFDLCSKCYDTQNTGKNHHQTHAMILFKTPITPKENRIYEKFVTLGLVKLDQILKKKEIVHKNYTCNGCKKFPIEGIRLKCDECFDFDYCLDCFLARKKMDTHNPKTHKMIAILNHLRIKFSLDDINIEEKLGKGCFGEVYKAKIIPFNNRICACKFFYIDSFVNEYNKTNKAGIDQSMVFKEFFKRITFFQRSAMQSID